MNQFGASIRSSPRRVLTFVYRGKIAPCNISMFSPNMNMRPYIGDESGIQLVPEPSRLIGSARSMVECISISISPWCVASRRMRHMGLNALQRLRVRCSRTAGELCSMFDVERFFSFIGTSFIPHFGQLPG